jgi:hypothetical protein
MTNDINEKIKEAQKALEEAQERLRALKEKKAEEESGFWEPKEGEKYYYCDNGGEVNKLQNNDDYVDRFLISAGEAFRTEEGVAKYKAIKILRQDIRKWKSIHDPESFRLNWKDKDQTKFYFEYNIPKAKWRVDYYFNHYHIPNVEYFSSEKAAKDCVEHFGDRLDLLKPPLKGGE